MLYLYHTIIYQPLLNILIFFYNTVAFRDLGVAIILLTVLIRFALYPLFNKSARHQMIMVKLQPKLKEIQETHKHDREKQAQATMSLYKEHGINPFSGFLLLLVQLPVLIALYQIFLRILNTTSLVDLYSFVKAPALMNASFLGLMDLSQSSIVMVVLAALAQYFQARLSIPKSSGQSPSPAERMGRQMAFIGPIITVIIFYKLPAAVSLYWIVTLLFSIIQQLIINRQLSKHELGKIN